MESARNLTSLLGHDQHRSALGLHNFSPAYLSYSCYLRSNCLQLSIPPKGTNSHRARDGPDAGRRTLKFFREIDSGPIYFRHYRNEIDISIGPANHSWKSTPNTRVPPDGVPANWSYRKGAHVSPYPIGVSTLLYSLYLLVFIDQHRRSLFIVCLLFSDFVQALGVLIQLRWLHLGGIQGGTACRMQAALLTFGDVASGIW